MWALVPHGAGLKGLFAGHCSVLRALWCPSTAGVQEASGPRLVVCLIPTFVGRQLWFLFPSTLCWSSLQSLELPWTLLKLYCYIFKYLWDLNCFSWKKNQQNKTTKTPKPTTTKKKHTKKKKRGKNNHPPRAAERANEPHMFPKAAQELLACRVSHPIFITEAKRVRQREEGRENVNAKNSFLPEIIPNRQKKKRAYGETSSHFHSSGLWRKHKKCSLSSHPQVFL